MNAGLDLNRVRRLGSRDNRSARSAGVHGFFTALAMLAANRYVGRPGGFTSYSVIWPAGT